MRASSVSRLSTGLLLASVGLTALPGIARSETLTLYSAQHEQMVTGLTDAFASQIVQEGAASPADLYFTENSPELVLLDEKGLLAPVDKTTLAEVPARFSADDGNWVGVLARENVLAYDPKLIAADKLPLSLLDLARPEWKGKIAIAPADADFLPLVEAIVKLKDRATALAWLKAMKVNAHVFDDDEAVVAAVDRGAVPVGIINNYYWARLHQEKGAATVSQIHHFAAQDVGALINVSGAAVLKSSKHQPAAQRFLAFLVSKPTQTMLGAGNVDFEYPLAHGVAANPLLTPFDKLDPPSISMKDLGDDQDAARLLREAGLL
jgi:iron(III) transport system substrate-binding protein